MIVANVPRRRRSRPLSLWIFLGNAIVLACVMFWYGVLVQTNTVVPSKDKIQFASWMTHELFSTNAMPRKQEFPFDRLLTSSSFRGIEESAEAEERYVPRRGSNSVSFETDSRHRPKYKKSVVDVKGTEEDSAWMKSMNTDYETLSQNVTHPCSNFDGVLHIKSGDNGAAAGTMFFQYVINQILYAEMYNLMPFVHLDSTTYNIFDDQVHGVGEGLNLTIRRELHVSRDRDRTNPERGFWPGKPQVRKSPLIKRKNLWFRGTGVWNHYLEPVSAFDPNHEVCQSLPYLTLAYELLTPGIHFFAPWAVRSWEYHPMPRYLHHNHTLRTGLRDWYAPQRIRAHGIVARYFRFRPHLWRAAEQLLPVSTKCLALHIRHSDKAGLARKRIPVEEFLPFVKAYLENGGDKVYLATDSSLVLSEVRKNWTQMNVIVQGGIIRSSAFTPVFQQGSHHRTNTEVLVDILAMSRCQFMIHGFSAVSESALYLNPNLHNQSVDLEDLGHINVTEFGELVKALA